MSKHQDTTKPEVGLVVFLHSPLSFNALPETKHRNTNTTRGHVLYKQMTIHFHNERYANLLLNVGVTVFGL